MLTLHQICSLELGGQPIAERVVVFRWLSTLNFLIPTLNELIFAIGRKPDTFQPTLCYIASINNHQEPTIA